MVHMVIVGNKEHAAETAVRVHTSSGSQNHIVGWIDVSGNDLGGQTTRHGLHRLGSLSDFEGILAREVVDEMLVVSPLPDCSEAVALFDKAHSTGITLRILHPDVLEPTCKLPREPTGGVCFGIACWVVIDTKRYLAGLTAKTILDRTLAMLFLVLSWPIMLVIAVAIRLSSKGPVFYLQERVGLHGRRFKVIKFRSMIDGADRLQAQLQARSEVSGPIFKIKNDPRIIPYVGRFLRRSSLDELPQLFNVLKGDMSLVGPRPATPNEVALYRLDQRRRLAARPGITGLWQSSYARNDRSFDERLKLDLKYIDEWSPMLDLWILCRTVLVVWEGGGQ
jgi:exopolysaccharide biosynthesis polyprenyl glycosylphosphotransferase